MENNKLKQMIKRSHKTQEQVAEEVGTEKRTISCYCTNRLDLKRIRFETLVDICLSCNCSFDELFTGSFGRKVKTICKK